MMPAPKEGAEVPVSALLRTERASPFGSIPGLDDEELASPAELERQVFLEEFAPILALPVQGQKNGFRRDFDENGIEWGAFASVDFDKDAHQFDKARCKAEKLREETRSVLIMASIMRPRLPNGYASVLKHVREGHITLGQISNEDVREYIRLQRRVDRLRKEICVLEKASHERREKEAAKMRARFK